MSWMKLINFEHCARPHEGSFDTITLLHYMKISRASKCTMGPSLNFGHQAQSSEILCNVRPVQANLLGQLLASGNLVKVWASHFVMTRRCLKRLWLPT